MTNIDIISALREQFGIVIGGGLEDLAGEILRIAHMCNTANRISVLRVLSAIEEIMANQGWKVNRGEVVETTNRIFA